jgi:hypothetical protein
MLSINKYSKKCLNNIINNLAYNIKPFSNKLLDKLEHLYTQTIDSNKTYIIEKDKELKNLHNFDDFPLLYLHYLETNKKITLKQFYNYYTENPEKILDLYKTPSKVLEIMENPISERKKLHENIYNNNFVTIDIQHISESSNLHYREIKLGKSKIYLYESYKKVNLELVIFILSFMENLAKSFNIQYNPIELILFMSPQKKLITNNIFLGPENINSGSTYSNNKVFIWRIEEIYKVLIHELIHYYGFDHTIFVEGLNKNSNHCIIGEDRQNEAYTESFAIIIHTFILSKYLKKDFFELFNCEINFSLYQCKKIMQFFNINNIAQLINTKKCSNPINQKTAVFSYFFIKTCFILNLEDTMNFILKNNHDEFVDFVNNNLTDENIDLLNSSFNNFKDEFQKKNKFIFTTLRMTSLEFS